MSIEVVSLEALALQRSAMSKKLSKLPYFCPISVENHIVSDETQTRTPIEKIASQKVSKHFYTPLRLKGTKTTIFIAFSSTKDALKKRMPSYDKGFKGTVL